MTADLQVGSIVEVPFSGRTARGCVLEFAAEHPEGPLRKLKPIAKHLSPEYRLEPELIQLALWIADYYLSPPGDALSTASFIGFNDVAVQSEMRYRLAPQADIQTGRLGAKQKAVLALLQQRGGSVTSSEIALVTGANAATLHRLVETGLILTEQQTIQRADDYGPLPDADVALRLNKTQQAVFAYVSEAMDRRQPRTFLLHGVTGSGKTEIYLQAIRKALDEGGEAIVLVPEISLTPQTVDRFRRRFGNIVGVYHSRLTLGQKFDLWRSVKSGYTKILVGARSAIFTPFENLRVVVVDEEHENSYKQDSSPRYHARDVAIKRAHDSGAVVVLGSATPSVETYYKAQSGKFQLLTLPERIDVKPMPPIRVIDMTLEAKENRNPDLFSEPLRTAIETTLSRGEQVLLFLNRRGFFNFMICMECNTPVRCKHCDATLTMHRPKNMLLCHYCGREYVPPKKCPDCENPEMSLLGTGTQRVEEHVQQLFPKARVIRMDLDTTRKRNAFLDAWRRIERGEVDIILGTQMIAKGIHLENVTLVGVPLADVSLFQPDFRAAERAFSVLTQVAGRAGRGDKPGQVILQTYVPHHYAIHFAQTHDYIGFYQKEIRVRQVLRFPPHYRLMGVLATGKDEEDTAGLFKEFSRMLRNAAFRFQDEVMVLGPVPAPIARINDEYRWRVLLRGRDHRLMRDVLQAALDRFAEYPGKSKIQLITDVDPMDLL